MIQYIYQTAYHCPVHPQHITAKLARHRTMIHRGRRQNLAFFSTLLMASEILRICHGDPRGNFTT